MAAPILTVVIVLVRDVYSFGWLGFDGAQVNIRSGDPGIWFLAAASPGNEEEDQEHADPNAL